jgi:hypothetical protein
MHGASPSILANLTNASKSVKLNKDTKVSDARVQLQITDRRFSYE